MTLYGVLIWWISHWETGPFWAWIEVKPVENSIQASRRFLGLLTHTHTYPHPCNSIYSPGYFLYPLTIRLNRKFVSDFEECSYCNCCYSPQDNCCVNCLNRTSTHTGYTVDINIADDYLLVGDCNTTENVCQPVVVAEKKRKFGSQIASFQLHANCMWIVRSISLCLYFFLLGWST